MFEIRGPRERLLTQSGTKGDFAHPNRLVGVANSQHSIGQIPPVRLEVRWIESEEFNEAAPMGFRQAILVLLPFLDCRIRNSKSKQFRQLRHGKREVDSLFAKVFSEGRRCGRVVP